MSARGPKRPMGKFDKISQKLEKRLKSVVEMTRHGQVWKTLQSARKSAEDSYFFQLPFRKMI
jgi:hypothetical protein